MSAGQMRPRVMWRLGSRMFMRERLGDEYSGTVSAVTSFGLFVLLDGLL